MTIVSIELVLVRHAQSRWNAERRFQGHGCRGLSERGLDQAERLAGPHADAFPQVHSVLSSDLLRVRQTAAPYLRLTQQEARYEQRWREIDVGTWAGLQRPEATARFPEEMAAWQMGSDVRRGGGETFTEMRERIWGALTDLAVQSVREQSDRARPLPVIVFAHGGPLRVAAASALDLPPLGHRWIIDPVNCSITRIHVDVDAEGGAIASSRLLDHDLRLIPADPELVQTGSHG